jgi:hypothetical protein
MANLVNSKNQGNKKGFNPNVDNSEKNASASGLGKFV